MKRKENLQRKKKSKTLEMQEGKKLEVLIPLAYNKQVWKRPKTYPAWFSQGPAHTSSHVSEATGARCYPSREERGEKNQKYSNNKRSFSRRALVIKNRQTNKLKKIKHSDHAIVIISTTTTIIIIVRHITYSL